MGPTFVLKTYSKEFRASGFDLSPLLLSTQLNLRLLRLNSTLMMRGCGTGMLVAGSNVFNVDKLVDLKVQNNNFSMRWVLSGVLDTVKKQVTPASLELVTT